MLIKLDYLYRIGLSEMLFDTQVHTKELKMKSKICVIEVTLAAQISKVSIIIIKE